MCLAIPGRIVEIVDEEGRIAKVDVSGIRRNISIALMDEVRVGDWVLIHVGFALQRVDEEEAQKTLKLLQKMGQAYQDELAQMGEGINDG